MIFYFDLNGNNIGAIKSDVYQGSNKASEIIFACPTDKLNSVSVAFVLPNGVSSTYYLMESVEGANGVFTSEGFEFNFWKILLPISVTCLAGVVGVQFFVSSSSETMSTSTIDFVVERGIEATEPEKTDSFLEVSQKIASLISLAESHADKELVAEVQNTVNALNVAFPRVESIAKGANRAVSFENYAEMILAIEGMDKNEFNVGQSIYIAEVNVPDLWVYSVDEQSQNYNFISEEEFADKLMSGQIIKVGFYNLCRLETSNIDVANFVLKSDLAVTDNGDGTATIIINA